LEIKYQLDATEVFIADLIACSTCLGHHYAHHQELKSIMQWFHLVLRLGMSGAVLLLPRVFFACVRTNLLAPLLHFIYIVRRI